MRAIIVKREDPLRLLPALILSFSRANSKKRGLLRGLSETESGERSRNDSVCSSFSIRSAETIVVRAKEVNEQGEARKHGTHTRRALKSLAL